MSYFGGSGVDTVELGGSIPRLAVFLGAGDDFLTLDAGTTVGSAVIDLGSGSDTYTDNGATFGMLVFMDQP